MLRFRYGLLLLFFLLGLGCDGGDSTPIAETDTPRPPGPPLAPAAYTTTEADVVYLITVPSNNRDPQQMSWSHDIRLAHQLLDTLVRLDWNTLDVQPSTAESWTVSDDGRTYTFTLRDDARWSDGSPVTAHDYIYAWQRGLLPDTAGSDYKKLFDVIEGVPAFAAWRTEALGRLQQELPGDSDAAAVLWEETRRRFDESVGLSAPDDRTLVVRLTRPVPYFLQLAAFATLMPVHEASVERATTLRDGVRVTDESYWADPARLVTNGPYVLKEARFKQYNDLEANPYYYARANLKNTSVRERIVEESSTALQQYIDGQAHLWLDVPGQGPLPVKLRRENPADLHLQLIAGTYFYNFNCESTLPDGRANPLRDPRVRRALSMAIDRSLLVKRVTQLDQPEALTFVPPDAIAGYEPPVEAGLGFDPAAAKRLLAEAGYPDGGKLRGLSILCNTGQGHEDIANAIAAMWRQHLGVSVAIEGKPSKQFSELLNNHQYSIARASWIGDYADPTTFLDKMKTGDGNNDAGWSNEDYDALLDQAAATRDEAERTRLLREAETILVQQAPMALLYHYRYPYLFDTKRVHGVDMNAWNRFRFETISVDDPGKATAP